MSGIFPSRSSPRYILPKFYDLDLSMAIMDHTVFRPEFPHTSATHVMRKFSASYNLRLVGVDASVDRVLLLSSCQGTKLPALLGTRKAGSRPERRIAFLETRKLPFEVETPFASGNAPALLRRSGPLPRRVSASRQFAIKEYCQGLISTFIKNDLTLY